MITNAIVIERPTRLEVYAPKLSRGLPIHSLKLKHVGKMVKLVDDWKSISEDRRSIGCKCNTVYCSETSYPLKSVSNRPLPRNTIVRFMCDNIIYLVVPYIYIG